MQKWIAFFTNDGADGHDESEWAIFNNHLDAVIVANRWRVLRDEFGYRVGVELVECPDGWLRIQLENDYDGTTEDDEAFWPIPSRGA
jgi:hypothetical protein